MTIGQGCVFNNNTAQNSSMETDNDMRGSGGALFYECDPNTLDCEVDIANTAFLNNYAAIKGGAIHWDTIEPLWGGLTGNGNTSTLTFKNN